MKPGIELQACKPSREFRIRSSRPFSDSGQIGASLGYMKLFIKKPKINNMKNAGNLKVKIGCMLTLSLFMVMYVASIPQIF